MGKLALVGLAAGTVLTGCRVFQPEPPTVEVDTYSMEDPSVVVLDETLERVDIDRGIKLDCPAEGEVGFCSYDAVEYHPVGVLLGQGVVRDLNGNLFAVPQLQVENNVTLALRNPEHVELEMPGQTADLRQTSPGTFRYDTTLEDGDYTIRLNGSNAHITNDTESAPDLNFSIQRESDSKVVLNSVDSRLLENTGEHIRVTNGDGIQLAQLSYDSTSYTVDSVTFTFEPHLMTRTEGDQKTYYEAYETEGGWEMGTDPEQSVDFTPMGPEQGTWSGQNLTVSYQGGDLINPPG